MTTKTWVGSGYWTTDANWSPVGQPNPGDDVIFDGFQSNGSCFYNDTAGTIAIKSLKFINAWYGAFNMQTSTILTLGGGSAGDLLMSSDALQYFSYATGAVIRFTHTTTGCNITTNGKSMPPATFNGGGGGWTLQDANTFASMTLTNGTLDTNGQTCNWGSFTAGSGTKTLTLGASTINLTNTTGTIWDAATNVTNLTLNSNTSTIKINSTSSSTRTFSGGALTYNNFSYVVTGSTGQLTITDGNTFATLNFTDATSARTIQFQDATTTTITGSAGFNVNGSSGIIMTIANSSTVAGHSHTLTYTGTGLIVCDYLSISHSTVTQSNTWYAGSNSTDGGNNTRWIFGVPGPSAGTYKYVVQDSTGFSVLTSTHTSTFTNHIIVDGYTIDCSSNAVTGQALAYNGTSFVPANISLPNPSSDYGQDLGTSSLRWSELYVRHIVSGSSTPSIAKGSGAGSTATISVNGTDMCGVVTLTNSGTAGSIQSPIFTLTFVQAYNNNVKFLIYPGNNNAGALSSTNYVNGDQSVQSTTAAKLYSGGGALTAGGAVYVWTYLVTDGT